MAAELTPTDALVQASFLVQGMLERRAGEHDLSLIQTRLLGILRDRTPTMNELARLLGLDKSSASGLIDRAQRRGLVRRVPSQLDRRSVRVRLTDDGRRQVESLAAEFAEDIAALLEPLALDDRAALTRSLSQVVVAHAAAQGVELMS
ncbi:MAG TPA: MarR family transcriptional regulator [Solirubrobacteraceae bacterium]|nr:MarR family transcriptional regulator [Solirubrobacteraceae bacterium]